MLSPCMRSKKDNNNNKPRKLIGNIFLFLLIVIHTLDMQLTQDFVGNNWERETFPLMSYCIKWFGIFTSLWISRFTMYSLMFLYILNRNSRYWNAFLIAGTLLYWAAMTQWLWRFDILQWNPKWF